MLRFSYGITIWQIFTTTEAFQAVYVHWEVLLYLATLSRMAY